jgi:UDP-N-acetylmuramoyl-tripeptide--D-alanyl-D-alanine ligase
VERLAARAAQAKVSRVVRFGGTGEAKLISHAPDGEGMRLKADIMGRIVDCLVGAPGAHIAANAVAALAAVALLDGDVLNAAAGLKDFRALKGRGARFQAGDVTVIDESYNANPASMAAALALLGAATSSIKGARKITVLGDMLEMGAGDHHAALAGPVAAANTDLVFAAGRAMKALWDALPEKRRGGYAENSTALAPALLKALRPGDTVLVKGSNGAKMSVIVEALKKRHG